MSLKAVRLWVCKSSLMGKKGFWMLFWPNLDGMMLQGRIEVAMQYKDYLLEQ